MNQLRTNLGRALWLTVFAVDAVALLLLWLKPRLMIELLLKL